MVPEHMDSNNNVAFHSEAHKRVPRNCKNLTQKIIFFIVITIFSISNPVKAEITKDICNEPIPDVFKRVSPCVVLVSATNIDPFRLNPRFNVVVGSGFIISQDGLVLTNSHLVFDSRSIMVTAKPNPPQRSVLIGADPILDIALLRIPKQPKVFQAASLGDSNRLRVGEEVLAIGNPMGFEQTLARGVVSGINRILPVSPINLKLPLIQTDAAINPGSSGGPLLDRCGRVVGITTSLLTNAENMGFAVPINLAKAALPHLIKYGRVVRPWIGIRGKLINASDLRQIFNLDLVDGFLVETVDPESPAEEAQILGGELPVMVSGEEYLFGGDIIFKINGRAFQNTDEFYQVLHSLKVGDRVRLGIYREGKRSEIELTALERPLLPGDVPPLPTSQFDLYSSPKPAATKKIRNIR